MYHEDLANEAIRMICLSPNEDADENIVEKVQRREWHNQVYVFPMRGDSQSDEGKDGDCRCTRY